MKEWICINRYYRTGFTEGKVYSTNEEGMLIDDDGLTRIEPEIYNFSYSNSFQEAVVELDNK